MNFDDDEKTANAAAKPKLGVDEDLLREAIEALYKAINPMVHLSKDYNAQVQEALDNSRRYSRAALHHLLQCLDPYSRQMYEKEMGE